MEACEEADETMTVIGLPHDQIRATLTLPPERRGGLPDALGRPQPTARATSKHHMLLIRRLVGGLVRAPGDAIVEKARETRQCVTRMIVAGARRYRR